MPHGIAGVIYFGIVSAFAIAGALGMIIFRSAVHSAISLIAAFIAIALLFLGLTAPMIATFQILVSAGAIMVLFVFVIMLLSLQDIQQPTVQVLKRQPYVAILLGLLVIAEFALIALASMRTAAPIKNPNWNAGNNVQAVGTSLFTELLFPFEAASILLLVGVIGIMYLAKRK